VSLTSGILQSSRANCSHIDVGRYKTHGHCKQHRCDGGHNYTYQHFLAYKALLYLNILEVTNQSGEMGAEVKQIRDSSLKRLA
jgi:hypothetical protein